MLRIVIILVTTVLLALADGPVLKTGQVYSYDEVGNIVTDGSIKDDGYYRKGLPVVYTHSYDVVYDEQTGLQWQDEESIEEKPWVTQINYDQGEYFDTSGDTATTYCDELNISGGGWRLPTIQELQKLVDYGQNDPSTTSELFKYTYDNRAYSKYWSSTTAASTITAPTTYDHLGRTVSFWMGSVGVAEKDYNLYVRCVRGEPLAPSNLTRSAYSKIVIDWITGLQWQDDESVGTTRLSWEDAIDYCENTLALGGWNDWRMPNSNELFSILDSSRRGPAIDTSVFVNTHTSYEWSSTTKDSDREIAWQALFNTGLFLPLGNKVNVAGYVRCVRSGSGEGVLSSLIPIILYLQD